MKAGERLILCGDEKQAIYGFAGVDSESMERMKQNLDATPQGCQVLPLTVTRRCGRAIVKEAQKIVPDFEAHESCGEGKISYSRMEEEYAGAGGGDQDRIRFAPYREKVEDGNMILCRVNAPLVSECFKFLKRGRRAGIQGRDIGQGLISTIRKLQNSVPISHTLGTELEALITYLGDWLHNETRREQAKRNPNEAKLIALQDRHDCILCFTEDQETVEGVIKKIEDIFTDAKNGLGIKLSSVHRAKGLEANRVFILQPEGAECPHPMAKSAWQREQEMNLLYVAITRAKEELVYVS